MFVFSFMVFRVQHVNFQGCSWEESVGNLMEFALLWIECFLLILRKSAVCYHNYPPTQGWCFLCPFQKNATLRIIGHSYRGVWICVAWFRDLQTRSFEIPRFLGKIFLQQCRLRDCPRCDPKTFRNPEARKQSQYDRLPTTTLTIAHVVDAIKFVFDPKQKVTEWRHAPRRPR